MDFAAEVESRSGSGVIPTRPRSSRSASRQTARVGSDWGMPPLWMRQGSGEERLDIGDFQEAEEAEVDGWLFIGFVREETHPYQNFAAL